jgi:hypothetical protein
MNPVPPLIRRCDRCRRQLRGAYAARGRGPVCGGPIRRSRTPAAGVDEGRHRAVENHPGQLQLFEDEEVQG